MPDGEATPVTVADDEAAATVDERFISFAVDTGQTVGGEFWDPTGIEVDVEPYDFTRPTLRRLATALKPAMLRIGGTEADSVYADLSDDPLEEAPEGFEHVMTRAHLDAVCDFAEDLGFDVFFTLNAGPGVRDEDLAWQPDQAREVITYLRDRGCPVAVWELGNEINGFSLIHGLDAAVSGAQYADDMRALRELVDELTPDIPLAGPSSAYWPQLGEYGEILERFLEDGGDVVDIVTWHYYPQQSSRCLAETLRAAPGNMLEPDNLDEVAVWAAEVEAAAAEHAPQAEVWLGETGHAQCGGEPGYSGTFLSVFWWLDQLGSIARRGQPVVVRQTLSGGDYQLIDDVTLEPTPDYWGSVLFNHLMGTTVLDASVESNQSLRTYAHCGPGEGEVVVLALNVDPDNEALLTFGGLGGRRELFLLDAEELQGTELLLNGEPLKASEGGHLPPLTGELLEVEEGPVWAELPATSAAFIRLLDADAAACR